MSVIESLYVLVDWDNAVRNLKLEHLPDEAALAIRDRALDLQSEMFPDVRDVTVRCYSAWLNPNRSRTDRSLRDVPQIEAASQRTQGLDIRFECASTLVLQGSPDLYSFLKGPFECERCGSGRPIYEQKMVDTMIVADATALADFDDIGIVVMSDDIDLAPGLAMAGISRARLAGSAANREVVWVRKSPKAGQAKSLASVIALRGLN